MLWLADQLGSARLGSVYGHVGVVRLPRRLVHVLKSEGRVLGQVLARYYKYQKRKRKEAEKEAAKASKPAAKAD